MPLVEQHIISRSDPRWEKIDGTCFRSKNLYNATLYRLRQHFFATGKSLTYAHLAHDMKDNPDYGALPRKVSQWVLKQVCQEWEAFFAAHHTWQQHPERFTGKPRLPHYKDKQSGRNFLTYTQQAVSRAAFKQGLITPSQLGISVKTQQTAFNQVRIVPRSTHYVVEIVYTAVPQPSTGHPDAIAAIDLGIDNLATITSNQPGFVPLLINGRPLKSINHHYNQELARLQACLPQGQFHSRRLDRLTDKRNRRVNHYLHVASRRIIDHLVAHQIGILVLGKNAGWKQGVNLGKRTNQNFVQIPHARFIEMLTYKAQLLGIEVVLTEESYTSKCSFLDQELIGKHATYQGKRVKRGLFRTHEGRLINADVNGSYNILRKAIPNAFGNGIGGAVVHPMRVHPA